LSGIQALAGFEPLNIIGYQRQQGDINVKQFFCDPRYTIEALFLVSVHQAAGTKSIQAS
jgi:hypothetical protein